MHGNLKLCARYQQNRPQQDYYFVFVCVAVVLCLVLMVVAEEPTHKYISHIETYSTLDVKINLRLKHILIYVWELVYILVYNKPTYMPSIYIMLGHVSI